MKNPICLILFCLFSFFVGMNKIWSQGPNYKRLPNQQLEELKTKFSKRAFIKNIEQSRGEYEEMIVKIKRYKDSGGNNSLKNDSELIAAYSNTKNAYNKVLDLMISDINDTKNIFEFHLFDSNKRYKDQLAEAKNFGDIFMKSAEKKISGDTKFIGKIIQWVIKIYPILRRIENIYLEHVKAVMIDNLEKTKLRDWTKVE